MLNEGNLCLAPIVEIICYFKLKKNIYIWMITDLTVSNTDDETSSPKFWHTQYKMIPYGHGDIQTYFI